MKNFLKYTISTILIVGSIATANAASYSSSYSSGGSSRSYSGGGGGSYGGSSSSMGGFSKPSPSPSSSSSMGGFSKPSTPSPSVAASPPSSSSPSSMGGFSKPSTPSPSVSTTTPPPSSPSSSMGGFSKPSTPSPSVAASSPSSSSPQPPSSMSGFSKPSSSNTAQSGASPNALSNASSKAMSTSSLQAYQAERQAAKQPPMPVPKNDPVYNNVKSSFGGNVDTYYQRRTVVYHTYTTSHPDIIYINSYMHPNYGVYDSGFLTGMFMGYVGASLTQNAMWMMSQQNQPWYSSYRADLDRQALQNAELRHHMAEMDAEIAKLRAQNTQVSVNTLPPGVDASLAIAPEAVIDNQPDNTTHYIWLWAFGIVLVTGLGVFFLLAKIGRS